MTNRANLTKEQLDAAYEVLIRPRTLLPLPGGLVLRLSRLLLCLLVSTVAAVGAACGSTYHAVTGIVASDATGDSAFNTALGVGDGHRAYNERSYREYDQGFHVKIPP
jgi:hypothetical protein